MITEEGWMKAGTGKMPEIDSFLRKTQAVGSWVHPSFVKLLQYFNTKGRYAPRSGRFFPVAMTGLA